MTEESSKIIDSNYLGLKTEQPSNQPLRNKPKLLPKLKTQQNQQSHVSPDRTVGSPTKFKKQRKIPPGYELASYEKAIEHWHKMSYSKKCHTSDGEQFYEQYSVFDDVEELKQYQLGVYLFMEFIKRLFLTCFIISAIMVLPLYLNYSSTGLSSYKDSFTLTLAKFTLGNLEFGDQKTYILESAADVLAMLVLFCFYFHWRSFHNDVVDSEEKDFTQLDPTMYVVSIVGFDPNTPNLQTQLKAYFDTIYRGAYQVEIVYDFKRNFGKFIDHEELIQKIEKEKQVIKQTDKTNDDLIELEKELEKQQQELTHISSHFDPIYAIIHFRNLKAKYAFINVCKKYGLVNKFWTSFRRCICCMPGLPEKLKFNKKDELMIESVNLARPETINWNNVDISKGSYFCRFLLSILFIAIAIFITSSLITLCTLYVTTSSNCGSYNSDTTLAQASSSGDKLTIYCFCSANYADIYTDTAVETLCAQLEQTILVANVVLVAASLLSTVTNILLIVVVSTIAEKLLKPDTKPREYNFVFVSVFLSNLINSTLLPLILNGDIFGFRSVSYLTFIEFINFSKISIFKDFDRNWFAVISPYYTNFFIIAAISPLIQITVYFFKRRFVLWRLKSKCSNMDPANPTIQKQADQLVCMFPIDLPTEMAVMCLQFFMCFMYSSLIPLAIPIFTMGLFLSLICKRYIILNYTKRIPADQSLNEKVINLIPFILLVHGVMGIWARTAEGVFQEAAFFRIVDIGMFDHVIVRRAILDIVLLAATGVVAVWIIFDFTIVTLFRAIREACKDELELPVAFSAIENVDYASRLRKSNILGSYKLTNHPIFRHPYNAYMELMKRVNLQKQEQKLHQSSQLNQAFTSSQINLIGGEQPSQLHLSSVINQ